MLPIVVAFVDIESTSIAANFTNEGFQVPVDAQVFKPDDYQVPTPETFRAPTDAAPNGPVIYQVTTHVDPKFKTVVILSPQLTQLMTIQKLPLRFYKVRQALELTNLCLPMMYRWPPVTRR
ncbi:unnamed protein product [Cuscuta epithymum]|uniref:Uncharacterized protein n=1 Tax=Cuscuta epithymum TaxID=186058 RepID=A0AAV0DEX4_9ASTE|nr:unnamed protein product [Cuscuta epithymum]